MPLVLGAAAAALIALTLLLLIISYYMLTQGRNFVASLAIVGGYLAQAADWLRDRNLELLRDVVGIAHGLLIWAIEQINAGFEYLHNAYNAVVSAVLAETYSQLSTLQRLVQNDIQPFIIQAYNQLTDLQRLVHGFVQINIDALNFWKAATQHVIDTFIIPNINALIARVDYVTGLQIPTIQARLGVAEKTIQQTLPAEIAQVQTDTEAVRRVLAQTTTAPGTGLLDRVGAIEKDLAPVLPWAAAIGLSIPIAANLAKLGRNPCWCTSEGPLQDNGVLELAALMDLI
jgi:hypothetical protein